ncbi:MAG: hypothetical protein ACE5GO_11375 [Anaerolineales bacterium]
MNVIQMLYGLFLHEPTWSATPGSLYCLRRYSRFIEVGSATAIPKTFGKEMQYA